MTKKQNLKWWISYQHCNLFQYNLNNMSSSNHPISFCKILHFDMGNLRSDQYLKKNKDNFKTIPDVSLAT